MPRPRPVAVLAVLIVLASWCFTASAPAHAPVESKQGDGPKGHVHEHHVQFNARSVADGNWSDPKVWSTGKVPAAGERVLVARGTTVVFDVEHKPVLRLLQIVGTLRFARDRDTELNACVVKVQDSDVCSDSGFACDLEGVNSAGEPQVPRDGTMPTLEVGTLAEPIPAEHTARIRLHFVDGMNKDDAPALVCCSARMELHGAPLSRTWLKLGADAKPGDEAITLVEPVVGWRVGDEIIVTGAKKQPRNYGNGSKRAPSGTEERTITKIEGDVLHLDRPLELEHYGSGLYRSEAANLSRNVIVESADPAGVRGHTMYHAFSQGGISYARFAHLGKEGVLGRYAIHFHLIGDTMRGSQILGAAIVDSHNRWITIHGTEYLVVRDCVGYRSLGHGFFMEDGTEVYNLLDRNLGVQAYATKKLPKQVLPFDQNDGAAFWWANGRNSLVRNSACENDQYGYRYDMQNSKSFSTTLPITMPDGSKQAVDVRTIPISRFDQNESHTEGLAGMVVAANGNSQPDTPIRDQKTLDAINRVDWTGPDARHPHRIRGLTIWEAHYAFRPQSPSMLIEDLRIHRVAYGVYRPTLENQVFRNVTLSHAGGEPFNRGMDDASAQAGVFAVDGLTIVSFGSNDKRHPFVHMSDNNLSGRAEAHFRNVTWKTGSGTRAIFNRGGSVRADPFVAQSVPYYLHDYFGPGRHAKIVSTAAGDVSADGLKYRQEPPLTGDESQVAEVANVAWPKLLDPVDDVPPATIVLHATPHGGKLRVVGVSHDDGEISGVTVNGQRAQVVSQGAGVVDWTIELPIPADGKLTALAADEAGNTEQTGHLVRVAPAKLTARR